MKRYEIHIDFDDYEHYTGYRKVEASEGTWVKYEDVFKLNGNYNVALDLLGKLQQEHQALKEKYEKAIEMLKKIDLSLDLDSIDVDTSELLKDKSE